MTDALVSTDWLHQHLRAPDVRIVDATWFLPSAGRDAHAEYGEEHLPGAVFFDIDAIADETSTLPHMVPAAAKFSLRVRDLGLGDGSRIIVYDRNRFSASARVWWMFRLFGHEDVAVLDGGLAKWRAEGRPTSDSAQQPRQRHFTARTNNLLLRAMDQVRANLTTRQEQLVDMRPAERFSGTAPEPRPGLRAGHVPGARNLPFSLLLAEDGTLRPPGELQAAFEAAGVDLRRPIVTSCGSGVTAGIGALALFELGRADVAVYDGSWAEWASRADTPVASA